MSQKPRNVKKRLETLLKKCEPSKTKKGLNRGRYEPQHNRCKGYKQADFLSKKKVYDDKIRILKKILKDAELPELKKKNLEKEVEILFREQEKPKVMFKKPVFEEFNVPEFVDFKEKLKDIFYKPKEEKPMFKKPVFEEFNVPEFVDFKEKLKDILYKSKEDKPKPMFKKPVFEEIDIPEFIDFKEKLKDVLYEPKGEIVKKILEPQKVEPQKVEELKYNLLENKNLNCDNIDSIYRKLSLILHPDKHLTDGRYEEFSELYKKLVEDKNVFKEDCEEEKMIKAIQKRQKREEELKKKEEEERLKREEEERLKREERMKGLSKFEQLKIRARELDVPLSKKDKNGKWKPLNFKQLEKMIRDRENKL